MKKRERLSKIVDCVVDFNVDSLTILETDIIFELLKEGLIRIEQDGTIKRSKKED